MEILLKKHELLDLGSKLRNLTLTCRAGCCWLTQAGDYRDYVLRPGSSVNIQSRGQVIVTASADCRLQLRTEAAAAERSSFWRQLCCNN